MVKEELNVKVCIFVLALSSGLFAQGNGSNGIADIGGTHPIIILAAGGTSAGTHGVVSTRCAGGNHPIIFAVETGGTHPFLSDGNGGVKGVAEGRGNGTGGFADGGGAGTHGFSADGGNGVQSVVSAAGEAGVKG
jgi:hypothetical protein